MDTDSAVRAVVAFPVLDADDRQWIEAIRAKHDPEAKRIAAHFTLVFPAILPLRATDAHITRVAHVTEPIRFVLRRATVVPDAIGSGGHLFLIPEDGRDALAGLHERLYEGALQAHMKRHSSFTPHVTVAASLSLHPLLTLAGELNANNLGIRGSISELALVDVTEDAIRPVGNYSLGSLV
ncbi:MAG TPA: 2'-5' RNA ligase family protein [Vicinamibacterales bacterium]|nr:2'-5' RNA ligase family protein [Vicinamibacterales bacterium]